MLMSTIMKLLYTGHEAPQAPSPKATLTVSGVLGRSPWENFEVFEVGEWIFTLQKGYSEFILALTHPLHLIVLMLEFTDWDCP